MPKKDAVAGSPALEVTQLDVTQPPGLCSHLEVAEPVIETSPEQPAEL